MAPSGRREDPGSRWTRQLRLLSILVKARRPPAAVAAGVAIAVAIAAAAGGLVLLVGPGGRQAASLPTPLPKPSLLPSMSPSLPLTLLSPSPFASPSPSLSPTAAPASSPPGTGHAAAGNPTPWRRLAAMAQGPGTPVVLYGGWPPSGGGACSAQPPDDALALHDTWVWDGAHWYRSTQAAGPRLVDPVMGWDPVTRRLILVGGINTYCGGFPSGDLSPAQAWGWSTAPNGRDGTWSRLAAGGGPSSGFELGSADVGGRLVFYGVYHVMAQDWGAWRWDGTAFTKIYSAHCAAADCIPPYRMVAGPGDQAIGVEPGAQPGAPARTFRWDGKGWTASSVATPAYVDDLEFDPASKRTVGLCGSPRRTCTWDGSSWSTSTLPPEMGDLALEFAGASGVGIGQAPLLWGGKAGFSATWTYAGGAWRKVAG